MSLAAMVSSCGMYRGDQNKDPELHKVLVEASSDLDSRGFNTTKIWTNVDSYEFSDDKFSGDFGSCKHGDSDLEFNLAQRDQGNHITINREGWNRLNHWERKSLLIHEAGHCAYGLKHSNGWDLMTSGLIRVYGETSYNNLVDNFVRIYK